jgi:CubicO group peptidase (beta-lactamase class C family)
MMLNPALEIRRALRGAVARRETPGAVCIVGTSQRILLRQAAGWRMLTPEKRPMRADTIFDVASLTKVVASTPCVMRLVEQKKLRLSDPLRGCFAEFCRGAKRDVTVQHLLLHTSGLPAHRDYWRKASGKNEIISMCLREPLLHKPGEVFEYSDLGFILLGEIVEKVSGESLADFATKSVFEPCGMASTCFNPPESLWSRCAATEVVKGRALCGVVHDENARAMGGVAGHAGVFSTAADLARYCQAILRGVRKGTVEATHASPLLDSARMRDMICPRRVPGGHRRALGWDVESPYSSPMGHLFGPRSFGHTGFTGCSLWLDPDLDTFVMVLTNRVHLGRDLNINGLRGKLATLGALLAINLSSR